MKMDRVAVLLLLAGVSGASIFMLLAQREHLLMTMNDFSILQTSNNTLTSSKIIYYTPTDSRNDNGSDMPLFDATGKSGNSFFYEKRVSESEYAFLEDKRQLERLN